MSAALSKPDGYRGAIDRARELVQEAIGLLDEAGAPADIAAHLELALHRMTSEIGPI